MACEALGGTLAVITAQSEQEALEEYLNTVYPGRDLNPVYPGRDLKTVYPGRDLNTVYPGRDLNTV